MAGHRNCDVQPLHATGSGEDRLWFSNQEYAGKEGGNK
jgi:hypothetical protein